MRYLLADNRIVDDRALVVINATNTRTVESLTQQERTDLGIRLIQEIRPAYDPVLEALDGPVISEDKLTETYTKRPKTAPELDADKTVRINTLQLADLLTVVLTLENDNRLIKAKLNALLTEISATTPKFTAGQVAQITMPQLITALKALL